MSGSVCLFACQSVCLSVWTHISGATRANFTEFNLHVACGRGPVFLWRHCKRSSGFVDNVTARCPAVWYRRLRPLLYVTRVLRAGGVCDMSLPCSMLQCIRVSMITDRSQLTPSTYCLHWQTPVSGRHSGLLFRLPASQQLHTLSRNKQRRTEISSKFYLLGPFHVPSVTRCRCRRRCGHRTPPAL